MANRFSAIKHSSPASQISQLSLSFYVCGYESERKMQTLGFKLLLFFSVKHNIQACISHTQVRMALSK